MIHSYTVNDYKILMAIIDKDDKKIGRCAVYGTTKSDIQGKVKLSLKKVTDTLNKFIEDGLVEPGAKKGKANTYIVTESGLKELIKVKTVD